jgi:hypothetical protein
MSGSFILDAWGRVIAVLTRGGTEDGISSAIPAAALLAVIASAPELLKRKITTTSTRQNPGDAR